MARWGTATAVIGYPFRHSNVLARCSLMLFAMTLVHIDWLNRSHWQPCRCAWGIMEGIESEEPL